MDDYGCSSPPRYLYRIYYPSSATHFTRASGFTAADSIRRFDNEDADDFQDAINDHFIWECSQPSPFITLFSDRRHASHWGLKECWRSQYEAKAKDWSLCVIDTN